MYFYESSAYGKWCEKVYGKDLKQSGMVTYDELKLMYKHIELREGASILDIGCGLGIMTEEVSRHYKSNAVGIDIDENMISAASEHYYGRTDISFEVMDGSSLEFKNREFDLICLFDTIYFNSTSEELAGFLDSCMDILAMNGKIVVFSSDIAENNLNIKLLDYNVEIGKWCIDRNAETDSICLSSEYTNFWQNAFKACLELKDILKKEVPEQFEKLLIKSSVFSDISRKNPSGMARWLNIIKKC